VNLGQYGGRSTARSRILFAVRGKWPPSTAALIVWTIRAAAGPPKTSGAQATPNQIVTITQTGGTEYFYYLPSGQVYSDQRNPSSDYQFSYDGYGHLASADLNSTLLATYGYNGFDQRAQKVAAATTDYIYDRAGHMIAEMNDATGLAVREYVWMDDDAGPSRWNG